ncbi:MAG: hypothetical protein E7434_04590 [Ruminococcaceae bacterium]|nr:hypothetical protein [Oscillospiraceae bacterium]
MSYYRVCPYCGCHLDPGEVCDCQKERAAPDATNIESGKVDSDLPDHGSTSILSKNEEDCQV